MKVPSKASCFPAVLIALAAFAADEVRADQCINDDLIVDGSACIGFDCVCNTEAFGFDTLRLKENNLRITFIDTSVAASFPRGDWQIRANESANGGANEFAIDWLGTSAANGSGVVSTPLAIEGDAPNNALYVDDGGRVGFGTSVPSVELHVVDGDSPTLRLAQDGSAGFTPQTWDVVGNETNFFVRDVTGGSALPFRIRPGAPSNSIHVANNGDVGLGTASPAQRLHVRNNDNPGLRMDQPDNSRIWDFRQDGNGNFVITEDGSGGAELTIFDSDSSSAVTAAGPGDVEIRFDLFIRGQCEEVDGACADYVFAPGYELPSLSELREFIRENGHLPNIPSAAEIEEHGINMRRFNFAMLEKIEELVLYTLEQHEAMTALSAENRDLAERLERLEALLE